MSDTTLNLPVTPTELSELHKASLASSVSAYSDIDLTKSEERKLWWIYFYHVIIFIFVFVIVWHLAMRMIFIYVEYKAMIDWIDTFVINVRSQMPADQQDFYYNFSSGYAIAFYYVYSHFPTNPFLNNAFPASVVYSYYTPLFNAGFTSNPENLQKMFVYASMGSYCASRPDQGPGIACMRAPDANEIICATYGSPIGNQQGYPQCSAVCIKATNISLQEWAASCIGSGGGGLIAAGGNPIGLVMGLTMQIGINLMSNQEHSSFADSQQFCTTPDDT